MAKNELERELKTYKQHRSTLLVNARNKFVLIHQNEIAGVFSTYGHAAEKGYERFGNVPFLVKQVLEEEPVLVVG
jgi:hypothetical protein